MESHVKNSELNLKRKNSLDSSSSKKKIRRTFKKLEIEGDGNCLFRAFSHHFNGLESEYEGVRLRIIKYVEKNWEQFQSKVQSVLTARVARSARAYVSYMGKDKTFGSEVEILAASLLFKTPIRVYLKKAKRFLPIYESDLGSLNLAAVDAVDSQNVLYLEYDEDNLHYNVLVPMEVTIVPMANDKGTKTSVSSTTSAAPSDLSLNLTLSSTPKSPATLTFGNASEPATPVTVTPKALFVNQTFGDSKPTQGSPVYPLGSPVKTAILSARTAAPTPTRQDRVESPRSTPARSSPISSRAPTPTHFKGRSFDSSPSSGMRECYIPLWRGLDSSGSRHGSVDKALGGASAAASARFTRVSTTSSKTTLPPGRSLAVLCLASTRDPAYLHAISKAARRHLLQYELLQKRTLTNRVTRLRAEGLALDAITRADLAVVEGRQSVWKQVAIWPYLFHSTQNDCPDRIYLYHLLFCLFALSQDVDEAFSTLARFVFFLQREDIEKYLTAYNLEFKSQDEETLEKILGHYRKSLKRDVGVVKKEYPDTYLAHEEIDHPCKPTDLSERQNCVFLILDSRHEEHRRILHRLSDHLTFNWKTSKSLLNPDSFMDAIVHRHPTKNGIDREIRVLVHHVVTATDNNFVVEVFPKDDLLIAIDGCKSAFSLVAKLQCLAKEAVDLLTFQRQQSIGDRIEDTHLMEALSSGYRVAVCLPTPDMVSRVVFYEKVLASLMASMGEANDEAGFLFLPTLDRPRPFHPRTEGTPLKRLAGEKGYDVSFLTSSRPSEEPVSLVLCHLTKTGLKPKKPEDELLSL